MICFSVFHFVCLFCNVTHVFHYLMDASVFLVFLNVKQHVSLNVEVSFSVSHMLQYKCYYQ